MKKKERLERKKSVLLLASPDVDRRRLRGMMPGLPMTVEEEAIRFLTKRDRTTAQLKAFLARKGARGGTGEHSPATLSEVGLCER